MDAGCLTWTYDCIRSLFVQLGRVVDASLLHAFEPVCYVFVGGLIFLGGDCLWLWFGGTEGLELFFRPLCNNLLEVVLKLVTNEDSSLDIVLIDEIPLAKILLIVAPDILLQNISLGQMIRKQIIATINIHIFFQHFQYTTIFLFPLILRVLTDIKQIINRKYTQHI